MNIVEGGLTILAVFIIAACVVVFGVSQSDFVTARADQERALIAGEVYAQSIENEKRSSTAEWWETVRNEAQAAAIFAAKAVIFTIALAVIVATIVAAVGGSRWGMNKAAAPIITQVGNGVALITHGGETIAIDLQTFQRGQLTETAEPSAERAQISLAVEMAKVASSQPVVMGALPSANIEGDYE